MKSIVISADGDRMVYAVPDIVAGHLEEYCMKFCYEWLPKSPDAKKYRINGVLCYNEADFIDYLRKYKFPKDPITLVENLGWIDFDAPLQRNIRIVRFLTSEFACTGFPFPAYAGGRRGGEWCGIISI